MTADSKIEYIIKEIIKGMTNSYYFSLNIQCHSFHICILKFTFR